MHIAGPVFCHSHSLMPKVGLTVCCVHGPRRTALIDSGITQIAPQIEGLIDEACGGAAALDYLLITHAHVDHVGCNGMLADRFSPAVVAHSGARRWLEDYDLQIAEFCHFAPDVIPHDPKVKTETLALVDRAVPLDITVDEGAEISLGGEVVLEAFHLPGHKMEELGWLERSTHTLILGDAVICKDTPFFHGYEDAAALFNTLDRVTAIVRENQVERIITAHYPMLDPRGFEQLVAEVRQHVQAIGRACESSVNARGSASLQEVFFDVATGMGRIAEYHTLATVMTHLRYLAENGCIREVNTRRYETVR